MPGTSLMCPTLILLVLVVSDTCQRVYVSDTYSSRIDSVGHLLYVSDTPAIA